MANLKSLSNDYLSEFVYGGIDGIVTTFAVVSAVAGAGLESGVVLILGFANLISDGLSMGISAYLAERSDVDQYRKQRRLVVKSLETAIEKSSKTISKHLKKYGFKGKDLDLATEKITQSANAADFIMKEEYGLADEPQDAKKVGFVTFISFLIVGIVPLLAYLADEIFDLGLSRPFMITGILAGLAFASIGWLKSRVAHAPVLSSVVETLVLGVVASGASFYIGKWLEALVN